MEGNAPVHDEVNPVRRITGEGRVEFVRTWEPDFDKNTGRGRGTGGAAQSMRGNYKSFQGINMTVLDECTSLSCISCKSYIQ